MSFKSYWGSQNFVFGSLTQATPIYRSFFRTQAGSVLHLCTKFEADCSIRSKVIRGVPNFAPPQTPFPGARDGQNIISWRRVHNLYLQTQFGEELCTRFRVHHHHHHIYRVIVVTDPQTITQTHAATDRADNNTLRR